jgi:hypothetical protein
VGAGVWLVTGAQASGKSTVADLLARRFERGSTCGVASSTVGGAGWVHVGQPGGDDDEGRRLLGLRYRLSSLAADEYAAAGFTTVVQDNIYGPDVEAWLDRIAARPRHLVVLRPSVALVEQRDEERRRSHGKVAYRGGFTPAENDAHLAATRRDLGLWLDTSEQTPEETVDEIRARREEAVVP